MQISTSVGTSAESQAAAKDKPVFPVGQMTLFVLVTVLFFLWGMSNNLTDILVQQFKKSFELTQFGAQLVQTANFLGYFCMAIPAALVMRRWGYKAGMILGLTMFGSGMLLFWPAAVSGKYVPFLVALFTVGCGASILETAANPFMAQFGPAETSERRLNFAQSFNPPGTIIGVIIGAQFIFSGVEGS
jgi:FHS family L-fucose permease-like MFS transporter